MRAHLVAVASMLAMLVLPSCSALGLDQIPVADCSRQGPDWVAHDLYCATLVMTNPVPDTCHAWKCGHVSHRCEISLLDADHDGAPSPMCAPPGPTTDCDDSDPSRYPGNPEICNGVDDDCDLIVDEGVIEGSVAAGPSTTLAFQPDQTVIAIGGGRDTTTVVARMAMQYEAVTLGGMTPTGASLTFSQPMSTIPLGLGSHAMAGLGGAMSSYALVVSETDGCDRFGLFEYTGSTSVTLRMNDQRAFPACPSMGSAPVSTPSVAGVSTGEALLAWYDAPADPRDCGAAPPVPVSIGTAYLDPSALGMNRFGDVVQLGSSVADGPPAIAAVDGSHFLVAYPQMDGTIAVHVVRTDASFHVTAHAIAYTEPAGTAGARQGVTLAIDPSSVASGTIAIGLAFSDGCGATPLSFRALTLSGTTLTAGVLSTTMGTMHASVTRRRLRLVAQPRAHEWLLTWDIGSGISAQRFDAHPMSAGMLAGPAFDVLQHVTSEHAVEPLSSAGPLYRLVTQQGNDITQATFGCGRM